MAENTDAIKAWSIDQVCELFGSCRLDEFCETARSEEVDGEALAYLWENNGLSELGLSKLQQSRLVKKLRDCTKKVEESSKDEAGGASPQKAQAPAEAVAGENNDQGAKPGVDQAIESSAAAKAEVGAKAGAEAEPMRPAESEAKPEAGAAAARSTAPGEQKAAGDVASKDAADGREDLEMKMAMGEEAGDQQDANSKIMAYVEPADYGVATDGYETAVCKLLHSRADPNLPDTSGSMPLCNAVAAGAHSVVALLLVSRVDPYMGLEYAKRGDDLMHMLLANPMETMDLGGVYNCYDKCLEWREARSTLIWARDRLHAEDRRAREAQGKADDQAEQERLNKEAAAEAERRAKEAQWMNKFKKGTKVRLSRKGKQAPPGYDWSDDAIMPSDVGEVLVCRLVQGEVDVFIKGPRGRTCSYDADQLEVVVH